MFLAVRELFYARGRFTLMGLVIALIAVLMVVLSGLTAGLVDDGVSGLKKLPVSHLAFQHEVDPGAAYSRSIVATDTAAVWAGIDGVDDAAPLGNTLINGRSDTGVEIDLALLGAEPDSFLAPVPTQGDPLGPAGGIVVSDTVLDAGIALGDTITVTPLGTELTVIGVLDGQHTFGHVDLAYVPLTTWQEITAGVRPGEEAPERIYREATAIALAGDDIDIAAGDAAAGTTTITREDSYDASPGFSAEMSTLSMIEAFLYALCALVVGAFFTVVTIQRRHEIAVLRAMGASVRYVLTSVLTQSLILLAVAVGVGVGAGIGVGAALRSTPMPYTWNAGAVATAAAIVIVLGMVGAAVAVLRITRVDPLTALGGNR